jgi:predicted MFS family arabinose efflux permease
MQSGIGPFVGVFLQAHGWASGLIGTAMTLGNVAGMLSGWIAQWIGYEATFLLLGHLD